jgi:endoglucanase
MRANCKQLFIATMLAGASVMTSAASDPLRYVGVNLAGAEFQGSRIPGKANTDYVYPNKKDVDYFIDRGMNTFRLPFRWERLQRNLGWDLEGDELARLDDAVAYMTGRGAYVVLDPHNYARYFGKVVGSKEVPSSALADFWSKLATHYKSNEKVIFGLMNEPHGLPADDWRNAAEASLNAIRATGAQNVVLVPGTAWTGAHSWLAGKGGRSNGDALKSLSDPTGPVVFEAHQYLDDDFSGTKDNCQSEDIGAEKLKAFTGWLRENKHRGFLGEFGVGRSPVCLEALGRMLQYMSDNSDVWLGWTYWAAGPWWGNYPFSVQPTSEEDKPQMKVLIEHAKDPTRP